MASPLLLRGIPLLCLRLQLHHRNSLAASSGLLAQLRRPLCTAAEWSQVDKDLSTAEKTTSAAALRVRDPPKYQSWNDPDYRKFKEKEEEILEDIEPIVSLTKDILHSNSKFCVYLPKRDIWRRPGSQKGENIEQRRYMDGECLTAEEEKVVVEKLLAYHPNSEDKIGCGLDYIMVDRHPQFRHSRCLFVVRTDGGWIDFSYQKCLRAYIRDKYPTHAERFIREHFKRSS